MPRPKLTPRQLSEMASAASAARWAPLTAEQRRAQTAPARRAALQRYIDRCPPDPEIADDEQRALDQLTRARQLRDADLRKARVQVEVNRRARRQP